MAKTIILVNNTFFIFLFLVNNKVSYYSKLICLVNACSQNFQFLSTTVNKKAFKHLSKNNMKKAPEFRGLLNLKLKYLFTQMKLNTDDGRVIATEVSATLV
jgi:hypothetical protein